MRRGGDSEKSVAARIGARDADLAALDTLGRPLQAHEQRAFARAQKSWLGLVEASLRALPPEARAAVGKKAVADYRQLLAEAPQSERVGIAQLVGGLLDARARLVQSNRLDGDPEAIARGPTEVIELARRFEGQAGAKDGQQHARAVLPRWVEVLGRDAKDLTAEGWRGLAEQTVDQLGGLSAFGFEAAHLAERTTELDAARAAHPGAPAEALAALTPPAVDAARLEQLTRNLPVLTPQHGPGVEGSEALREALLNRAAEHPDLLQFAEPRHAALRARLLTAAGSPQGGDGAKAMAALVAAAPAAAVPALVASIAEGQLDLTSLGTRAEAKSAVEQAATAKAPGRELLKAVEAIRGAPFPEAAKAVEALPAGLGLRAVAVLAGAAVRGAQDAHLAAAWAEAAVGRSGLENGLRASLQRAQQVAQLLGNYPILREREEETLLATSESGLDPVARANEVKGLLQSMSSVAQRLPKASLPRLVSDSDFGAGMPRLNDATLRWATPPVGLLDQVLAAVGKVPADAEAQTELAQLAVALTFELAQIHGGAQLQVPRAIEDFGAAAARPGELKGAAKAAESVHALRAQGTKSLAGFVASHPELPVELAATAGRHLSARQMTWLSDMAGKLRGAKPRRDLRDFVFGCIAADRLDAIEVVASGKAPTRGQGRFFELVANDYRGGQIGMVPFDELVEGLSKGEDAVAKMASAKAAQVLVDLNLTDLVDGEVSPEGAAQIEAQAANLADLLGQLQPNFTSTLDAEIDYAALRPIFLENLKAVAEGAWPGHRYESEIGRELLAGCSDAQREAWMASDVTFAGMGAPVSSDVASAAQLVRGTAKVIAERLGIPAKDATPAALARSEKAFAGLLEQLRSTPKNHTRVRAELGAKAGALRSELALHRLLAAVAVGGADGQLLELTQPLLRDAGAELRRAGHMDLYVALNEASLATSGAADGEPSGTYAIDSDSLGALIGSHKSGCLSQGDKRRRWGMVGALADANIKMLRVMKDDKQVYRTFFKLFDVKLPGYQGPALYIDNPVADGGGSRDELLLLQRHLAEKAARMGVPMMASVALDQAAQSVGFTVAGNVNVELSIHDGHTGYMHSDHMFVSGKGSIRDSRGQNERWQHTKSMWVAMPPQKDGDNAG